MTTIWRDMATGWSDMATGWFDAVDSLAEVMRSPGRRAPGPYRTACRDCDCDPCCCPQAECCERGHCDSDCHCRCCIGDADLVVHMRVGESRVVPLQIENPRKRTREISLELSEFTSSGGADAPVQGRVQPSSFVLEACEERIVTMTLTIPGISNEETSAGPRHDVDDCVVAYADLRVKGCDIRPIRIAVAIVPRDCDPYEISCGCGCC